MSTYRREPSNLQRCVHIGLAYCTKFQRRKTTHLAQCLKVSDQCNIPFVHLREKLQFTCRARLGICYSWYSLYYSQYRLQSFRSIHFDHHDLLYYPDMYLVRVIKRLLLSSGVNLFLGRRDDYLSANLCEKRQNKIRYLGLYPRSKK